MEVIERPTLAQVFRRFYPRYRQSSKVSPEQRRSVVHSGLSHWSGPWLTKPVVKWIFTPRPDGTTFVSMTNMDFFGDDDQIMRQALDSTEGFTLVLAGLKAFLEHEVRLNLVRDCFPDGIGKE